MRLLNDSLCREYQFVSAFKDDADKQVVRLRHRNLNKDLVKISFIGQADIYQTLLSISQVNLPNVYEVWEEDDKVHVLEEYIDGINLSQALETKVFTEREVSTIVVALCDALAVLHDHGIIHRDIKPENVMLTAENRIVLIDFDAARRYKLFCSKDTLLIGTAGYAAPEQYGFTQSDERTDIYSLGVLMNVMLTGQHPSARLYNGKMRRIIEKCLRIDPADRFPSALYLKNKLL